MDALSACDALVQEYLHFRGFVRSLAAFDSDRSSCEASDPFSSSSTFSGGASASASLASSSMKVGTSPSSSAEGASALALGAPSSSSSPSIPTNYANQSGIPLHIPHSAFSVSKACELVNTCISSGDHTRLWRLFEYLDEKAFAHVPDAAVSSELASVKSDVFKLLVVSQLRRIEDENRRAVDKTNAAPPPPRSSEESERGNTEASASPRDCLEQFFAQHGYAMKTADASWEPWLGVMYTTSVGPAADAPAPSSDARFAACFSKSFAAHVMHRFENLLARALEHAPLPTLLALAARPSTLEDRHALALDAMTADRDAWKHRAARLQARVDELEADRRAALRAAVEKATSE